MSEFDTNRNTVLQGKESLLYLREYIYKTESKVYVDF